MLMEEPCKIELTDLLVVLVDEDVPLRMMTVAGGLIEEYPL
jgi:hypothetical protein